MSSTCSGRKKIWYNNIILRIILLHQRSFFIFSYSNLKCSQFNNHCSISLNISSQLFQCKNSHLTCCKPTHTPSLSPSCLPGLSDFLRQNNQRIVRCLHKTSSIFSSNIKFGTKSENPFQDFNFWVAIYLVLVSTRYP